MSVAKHCFLHPILKPESQRFSKKKQLAPTMKFTILSVLTAVSLPTAFGEFFLKEDFNDKVRVDFEWLLGTPVTFRVILSYCNQLTVLFLLHRVGKSDGTIQPNGNPKLKWGSSSTLLVNGMATRRTREFKRLKTLAFTVSLHLYLPRTRA